MFTELTRWAQVSPADDFWGAMTILIVLTLGGFIGAFYYFSRKRMMENTPTSKIRSAAQGFVELEGRGQLLDGPPIIAPLSGITSLWFSYEIEEHRGSGKNSRWVTVENGVSDGLFLLKDDTGQCIIDPDGAVVTPSEVNIWYGSSKRPSSGPRVRGKRWFSFGIGRFRYTEKRIHPKEAIYAIGLFKTVGGAGMEIDLEADLKELLKEWKKNSELLLERFDQNKDGQIGMEEWQNVREAALKEVTKMQAERHTIPPVNTLSKTMDKRRSFIISAVPQQVLIKRFQNYSAGLISLFFLAGSLATWLISIRTNS
ncbi:MAG: hypothetical protein EPO31_13410 [Gammaproteobacteria bacterium]|jgi:hypothetical protein|nr:MAG: hypothetical protein EPO31_13410 [Gammaproteobacteria bacterium]